MVPCPLLPQGVAVEHWCCIVPWRLHLLPYPDPGSSDGKESASTVGDPRSGRSTAEGNGNPLQHSCLENPTDEGAWLANSPWGCKESDPTERLFFLSFQIPTRTTWYPKFTLQVHGCWFTVKFFSNASQPHPLHRVRMSSALQILRDGPASWPREGLREAWL